MIFLQIKNLERMLNSEYSINQSISAVYIEMKYWWTYFW